MCKIISVLVLSLLVLSPFQSTYGKAECAERLIVSVGGSSYFDFGFNDFEINLGESLTIELPESIGPYGVSLSNGESFSLFTSPSNLIATALSVDTATVAVTLQSGSSVKLRLNYIEDPRLISSPPPIPSGLFSGGISLNGGLNFEGDLGFLSYVPQVDKSDQVFIGGVLCPLSDHIGKPGNIYVVVVIGSEIFWLSSGQGLEAVTPGAGLIPYLTDIELKESIELTLYDGALNVSAEKVEFYIGYSLVGGDGTLWYEPEPSIAFKVN